MDRTSLDHSFRLPSIKWSPKIGEWVEVRREAEILAVLDSQGDCDRMPFMPEMLKYAGRRFRVTAIAHKTCDTISKDRHENRRLRDAVHLDNLRCDGAAHGGCQADCLLFWKTSWLRPSERPIGESSETTGISTAGITDALTAKTNRQDSDGTIRYRCQATQLLEATEPLAWWNPLQYWADVRSGNATISHVCSVLLLAALYKLRRLPIGYRFNVWLYDRAHRWLRGQPDPRFHGAVASGQPTPDERLDLRVGDLVEVKAKNEIEHTINENTMKNRGLQIDEEMTTYCGGRYRVASRVERIINEQSGEMMHFKNPCIVLDNVYCLGEYSARRLLCPRKISVYWREIWLKRIDSAQPSVQELEQRL